MSHLPTTPPKFPLAERGSRYPELRPLLPAESSPLLGLTILCDDESSKETLQPTVLERSRNDAHGSRRKASAKSSAEWNRIKSRFEQLYVKQDMELTDVMRILEDEENFQATLNQYKSMINKWKMKKNITKREYAHMVRKAKERQKFYPSKRTRFFIRGQPVGQAKIDRFESEHPNTRIPRSTTPSSIACHTEISGSSSNNDMGEHRLIAETSMPINSSMAVTTVPSQGTSEQAARLWLNYDLCQESGEEVVNHAYVQDSGNGVVTIEETTQQTIEKYRIENRAACDVGGASCPASHTLYISNSRYIDPDINSPKLYPFDWWLEYRGHSLGSRRQTFGKVLKRFFPKFVLARDTHAAEMTFEQKQHEHLMFAVEADLCSRFWTTFLKDVVIKAAALGYLPSDKNLPTLDAVVEDLWSIMSNYATSRNDSYATTMILWLRAQELREPDVESYCSNYPVDVTWCISEAVQANCLGAFVEPWATFDQFTMFATMYGKNCWSENMTPSNQTELFNGFMKAYVFGFTTRLCCVISQYFAAQPSSRRNEVLPYISSIDILSDPMTWSSERLFSDIRQCVQGLFLWFDPMKQGDELELRSSTLQKSLGPLKKLQERFAGVHASDAFARITDMIVMVSWGQVINLRMGQTMPIRDHYHTRADILDAVKRFRSSPDLIGLNTVRNPYVWPEWWVAVRVHGCEALQPEPACQTIRKIGSSTMRAIFEAAADDLILRCKLVEEVVGTYGLA